jgi:chromate reductase, NAD(P)H dehydrogenase (quinone)
MLKVGAIAGSLRRESFNHRLLEAAVELAPAGMDVRVARAVGSIPLFDADLERDTPAGPPAVRTLRAAVAAADGILIATPEYNQSLSGVLKNLIDWLSRPAPAQVLVGKPIAIVGASSGPWGTRLAQAALRQVLYATESRDLPAPSLYVSDCQTYFDSTGRLVDQRTREQLATLLRAFQDWMPGYQRPQATSPGPNMGARNGSDNQAASRTPD